jgi:hypothetical protein
MENNNTSNNTKSPVVLPLVQTTVVDYPKWNGPDITNGSGNSMLLNDVGKMCCLGFSCLQSGVPQEYLEGVETPGGLTDDWPDQDRPVFAVEGLTNKDVTRHNNSELSTEAIEINDSLLLPDAKIDALFDTFQEYGYKIVFKNVPQEVAERVENKNALAGPTSQ